ILEAQEAGEGVAVERRAPAGMRAQALQLRAEQQQLAELRPIERLDAEPVADEIEHALAPVPERHREHADEALDRRLDAPLRRRLDDHLGIAMAAEAAAERLELGPELGEIIRLAIERDHEAAAGGDHRLCAGGGEVDDRESAMAEDEPCLRVVPLIAGIRP